MWLIAGLGNPGSKYENTPHNLGFECVDELVRRHRLSWQEARRFQAVMASGSFKGEKLYFLKPMTFMNLSGGAIQPAAAYYQIPVENILVVCDEVQLPYGRIRLRTEGSHGGHNGLRDIVQRLGGNNFPRLRIGCQAPHPVADMAGYVLGPLHGEKRALAALAVEAAADCIESVIADGPQKAMSIYNAWKPAGET